MSALNPQCLLPTDMNGPSIQSSVSCARTVLNNWSEQVENKALTVALASFHRVNLASWHDSVGREAQKQALEEEIGSSIPQRLYTWILAKPVHVAFSRVVFHM